MAEVARLPGRFHRRGHPDGVAGVGDSGIEQDAVSAELHGDGDVARRADAGVDDDREARVAPRGGVLEPLEDHRDRRVVGDAAAAADGAACGHDAGGSRVTDPDGHDGIVAGVAHDREAVGDQLAARLEGAHRVRQQGRAVAEDLELHPRLTGVVELLEDLASQAGHPDRVVGREAPGGVGQDRVPIGVDEAQQRPALRIDEPLAADGDGDHLGAGRVERLGHDLVALVLAGADDQPAVDRDRAELDRLCDFVLKLLGHRVSMGG